jgi:O-methyltransferase
VSVTRKLAKLLRNPWRYAPLALRALEQPLCYVFRNTAFFLQGQMDIHPRSRWHTPEFVEATGGFFPKEEGARRRICDLEPWDNTRRDMLVLLLRTLIQNEIEGDFAEVGVYRGRTAKLLHHYAPERRLHLFDTFEGFGRRSAERERSASGHAIDHAEFSDTSLALVRTNISPVTDNVFFYKGYFPESIPEALRRASFSFVHLDADLYEPTLEGLSFFFPRMRRGGFLVVHDYNTWPGARKAVDEYFSDKADVPIPMPDKSGSALVLKQ